MIAFSKCGQAGRIVDYKNVDNPGLPPEIANILCRQSSLPTKIIGGTSATSLRGVNVLSFRQDWHICRCHGRVVKRRGPRSRTNGRFSIPSPRSDTNCVCLLVSGIPPMRLWSKP